MSSLIVPLGPRGDAIHGDGRDNSRPFSFWDTPMTDDNKPDAAQGDQQGPRLYPEDQERVDAFLKRGVNSVERKPFRPLYLMIMLILVVGGLSLFSQLLARLAGVP